MKSKITKRLIFYFLLVILLFSIISGVATFIIGRDNMVKSYMDELRVKTVSIASSINSALEYEKNMGMSNMDSNQTYENGQGKMKMSNGQMRRGQGRGLGSNYVRWIEEFLKNDVRIVYSDSYLSYHPDKNFPSEKESISDREAKLIKSSNSGVVASDHWIDDKGFTEIAVSAPLYDENSSIIGAVIVNDNQNFTRAILDTVISTLLYSMIIGGLLAIGLAIYFANRFVNPLNKINESTRKLIQGDYHVKNGIFQNDEIGDLANNIDELAIRLDLSKRESKLLDQMRDDFVSSMSHELKTPVTVLKSSLEALDSGVISDPVEVKEYHSILYKESEILERLILELMDLNILRNPKYVINAEEIDLIEILNDAIRGQKLMAIEKKIEVKTDFQDSFITFEGDYTRLRQMFTTIIDNAIKYSKVGGKILINQEKMSNQNVIRIINYDSKISDKTLAHIFEPFYRDKDNKEKGFGLGLAIAKEIASHHGISLKVESDSKETIFSFTI